jgi:hypothetical protein
LRKKKKTADERRWTPIDHAHLRFCAMPDWMVNLRLRRAGDLAGMIPATNYGRSVDRRSSSFICVHRRWSSLLRLCVLGDFVVNFFSRRCMAIK